MNLFDASALLTFLQGEAGADVVERALEDSPGSCSAANWSEVMQKVLSADRAWEPVEALLLDYGLTIEPVLREDAEAAARLWRERPHLSLGDRLCLATGARLGAAVWTADLQWGADGPVKQIRTP